MANNLFIRHKARTLSFTLGLMVLVWLLYVYHGNLDRDSLMAFSERLHPVWVCIAFLILPLCGVPIRIMLVLVGFRFGFIGGWVVAVFGLLFHNFAAYFIARGTFRARVLSFLWQSGYAIPSIPAKHRIWFTAVIAAVPGPPYFTKLYLLALTDLPFRIYAGVGAPIYILLSFVPIGVGSAVTDFDMKWVYVLTVGFVLTLFLGFWLKKHYSVEEMFKKNPPISLQPILAEFVRKFGPEKKHQHGEVDPQQEGHQ